MTMRTLMLATVAVVGLAGQAYAGDPTTTNCEMVDHDARAACVNKAIRDAAQAQWDRSPEGEMNRRFLEQQQEALKPQWQRDGFASWDDWAHEHAAKPLSFNDVNSPTAAEAAAKLRAQLRAPVEAAKARAQNNFEDQHNFAATIDRSKDTSWTAILTQLTAQGGQTQIVCDIQCKGGIFMLDKRDNGRMIFTVETWSLDKKTLLLREFCSANPDGTERQCLNWDTPIDNSVNWQDLLFNGI